MRQPDAHVTGGPVQQVEWLVRLAGIAVVVLTLALAGVELGRIALIGGAANTIVAAVATALFLPLHVWHLSYGLRGERPPRSAPTLAVIVLVEFGALAVIGPGWSFMLAMLATSSLIVLRPPWSWVMFLACVLAPVGANVLHPAYTAALGVTVLYLMWSVAYRSCLQFVLVWLVAGAHELVSTREVVAREAAEREHERLEQSMRASLERSLSRLALEARRARAALLEPGVSHALVALDHVFALATLASDQLRASVASARSEPRTAQLQAELSSAGTRARSPVGRGLTRPGARRSFVGTQLFVLGVVPLAALGAFGPPAPGAVVLPAWLALTVVQLSSLRDVARGMRPPWAYARLAFALAVTVTMMIAFGFGWRDPGWFVGVAVAVAFTGRRRMVLLGFLFLGAGVYGAWRAAGSAASLSDANLWNLWDFSYEVSQTALGVIALYGSARLIMLLGELDVAREEQIRYAVQGERGRAWRDLHDVLGQTLVAIALKADLARRLLTRSPQRSRSELDELIELAAGQAQELTAIAHGERAIEFETELDNCQRLLRAAGIQVSTEIEAGELDADASAVLGIAVREGTTNILRHARARRASIVLNLDAGQVNLEIRNDGIGRDVGSGTGLHSLAERAAAADGSAAGSALPGGEYVLEVRLPSWERV